ncbi:MAG: metal-sensing transcriptional repressor [Candidatus Moraniibacteriota bacterium]
MTQKERIAIALKKARTSIEKILGMVEEKEPDCFSVIQQNLAVIGLLKSANLLMLESHMDRATAKLSGAQAKQIKLIHKELLKIVQIAQNK